MLADAETEHGEVVVGLGTVAVGLDGLAEVFDDVLGGVELGMAEDIEQTIIAKLVLFAVFGFVESIAVEEERTTFDGFELLTFVFEARPKSDGSIGKNFEEITMV